MKKKLIDVFLIIRKKRKLLLVMKLTIVILFACFMQVSATVYSQATKFSFAVKKTQVVDILRKIEDNSEFRFFYQREQVDVERKINLNVEDKTVEEILSSIFKNEGISYKVLEDKLILITPDKSKLSDLYEVAQQKTITGTVTDEAGDPLPGVTVVVKGTTNGTVTSMDGNYSISNIPEDAVLVFSFVGMRTQEITYTGKQQINVVMTESVVGLDEVVVTALGITRDKKSLGYSVGEV